MDIRWRNAEPHDLETCRQLLEGHLAYPHDTLAIAVRAWKGLLRDRAMHLAVIEDHRRPPKRRVIALGASVFVDDRFMDEAREGAEPYLSARALKRELEKGSPILRMTELRRANSTDGLNLLVLHYAESRALTNDERLPVRYAMLEAFIAHHKGYRIKEILQEYWDEVELPFVLNGWGRLRTDYAAFFERRGKAPPASGRPHLIGLTQAEAMAEPGGALAQVFVGDRPRFFFRDGEQELLHRALLGETDLDLAGSLRLAMATVKSRWKAIYTRVAEVAPELLSDQENEAAILFESRRGKEKRRRLLEYLRRHPEELRPYLRESTAPAR